MQNLVFRVKQHSWKQQHTEVILNNYYILNMFKNRRKSVQLIR